MAKWPGVRPAIAAAMLIVAATTIADAEKIANPVAVFMGLDKVTGRILTFDAYIGETVRFGSLLVKPRVCYDRPPTEPAQTDAFIEVSDRQLDGTLKQIFSGWVFAASPGLNSIEHPVYDVWLYGCAAASNVARPEDLTHVREAQPSAVQGVATIVGPGFDIPPLQSATSVRTVAGKAGKGKGGKPSEVVPGNEPMTDQPED